MSDAVAWLDAWPDVLRNEALARHSQYGIGGPADWYLKVPDIAVLPDLMRQCRESGVAVTVLGAGSNTLILDGGIRGLVIEMTDKTMTVVSDTVVELRGGCMMPRAALDCAKAGIAGIEFGIGIPGTCGASVRGNAGAFGFEIKDVLIDCDAVLNDGSPVTLSADDCHFAYRTSVFKQDVCDAIVVAARFAVHSDVASDVRARTDAIQAQRKASQPYGIRSLGSVFTNPVGDHAGRLIEAAGLKGLRIGGAEISTKHANFIVNVAGGSARDVLALVETAHDRVVEAFGVDLEREIVVVGTDNVVEATATPSGSSET